MNVKRFKIFKVFDEQCHIGSVDKQITTNEYLQNNFLLN